MPNELIDSAGTSVTATVAAALVGAVERVEDVVVHLVDVIARQHQHLLRWAAAQMDQVAEDGVRGAVVPLARHRPQRRLQQLHAAARCDRGPTAARSRCADAVTSAGTG